MRLVLLGVTGGGKSTLGNTILRKKRFLSRTSKTSKCTIESVEMKCESAAENVNGIEVKVVDTTGFNDLFRAKDEIKEVATSIKLLAPGPHVFLIVLNPTRFYSTDRRFLKDIEALLGTEVLYKYAMVVFTRKMEIDFDMDWQSIHEFVRARCCDEVQQFISKCNNRVIAVENLCSKVAKDAESERVLNFVGDLIQNNNNSYYKCA
ncbi:hypothetical protein FSP39_018582 [Pinctada imbricata]|uniref:AIG1-type G domain-containing protein n=1 Tax=Pinctada imbricata TaxID=66713 RepID=A0AA88YNH1_PINIB|nr:hypothetical protein FSP39_018582 [Pinctada imbricata]